MHAWLAPRLPLRTADISQPGNPTSDRGMRDEETSQSARPKTVSEVPTLRRFDVVNETHSFVVWFSNPSHSKLIEFWRKQGNLAVYLLYASTPSSMIGLTLWWEPASYSAIDKESLGSGHSWTLVMRVPGKNQKPARALITATSIGDNSITSSLLGRNIWYNFEDFRIVPIQVPVPAEVERLVLRLSVYQFDVPINQHEHASTSTNVLRNPQSIGLDDPWTSSLMYAWKEIMLF